MLQPNERKGYSFAAARVSPRVVTKKTDKKTAPQKNQQK
jgi:hypothetical protein